MEIEEIITTNSLKENATETKVDSKETLDSKEVNEKKKDKSDTENQEKPLS